jgi:hypothetical protein
MANQIIEFSAGSGETFTCKACAVDADSPIKTANAVAEVANHPGLYRATFTDQDLATGLWNFWTESGESLVARGLVNITSAAGTFRETIEATATVDGFTEEWIGQLQAAEIDLSQWDPTTEPAVIYRGLDHLVATENAFNFRNVAGSWPDLTNCTVRMELRIHGVRVVAGEGQILTASGPNQHVAIEVLQDAFDSSTIKEGTGVFNVVRIDADDKRFPLAHGVVTLVEDTAPAA